MKAGSNTFAVWRGPNDQPARGRSSRADAPPEDRAREPDAAAPPRAPAPSPNDAADRRDAAPASRPGGEREADRHHDNVSSSQVHAGEPGDAERDRDHDREAASPPGGPQRPGEPAGESEPEMIDIQFLHDEDRWGWQLPLFPGFYPPLPPADNPPVPDDLDDTLPDDDFPGQLIFDLGL